MLFFDNQHREAYNEICGRMKRLDCYHLSMAYLLALDVVLRKHVEAVYNFDEDCIKLEGLHKGFQTGSSLRTTRLAFNLWNGYCGEGEEQSKYYSSAEIFCNSTYAPYYWQAIQIRFG